MRSMKPKSVGKTKAMASMVSKTKLKRRIDHLSVEPSGAHAAERARYFIFHDCAPARCQADVGPPGCVGGGPLEDVDSARQPHWKHILLFFVRRLLPQLGHEAPKVSRL